MKKIKLIILIVCFLTTAGISQSNKDYVLLGQLYGTAQFGFPEIIKGRVKEFRQMNYFPGMEDGKVVKLRSLTTADRVTAPSGRDYFEEYDSSGTVIKSGTMDENGKLIEYWDMDTDSGKILRASYYTNDRLVSEIRVTYSGRNLTEVTYYFPGSDMIMRKATIEYNPSGNRARYNYFNSRNQLASYTCFIYNGNLPDSIMSYTATGRMTIMFKYGYDGAGHRISQYQENYTDGDKRGYRFEYEYDNEGNYIKVIFIRDNKPLIIRERHIKYYE